MAGFEMHRQKLRFCFEGRRHMSSLPHKVVQAGRFSLRYILRHPIRSLVISIFCLILVLTMSPSISYEPRDNPIYNAWTPLMPSCDESPAQVFNSKRIPKRPIDAMSGSQFAQATKELSDRKRQEAAIRELQRGNIPEFLRNLKPVHLEHKLPDGRIVRAIVWVTPDYLSIGSDEDFLRIPLTRPSAVTIASLFGFVLPTRKIVDAVAEQAEFRFKPQPLPPGRKMRSMEYYVRHNKMIEEQHQGRPNGELVAGHKKDVVLTNRLFGPERIAIYGWHRRNGQPIQGLSTIHGARYADYSHGIRLVYENVCIDGQIRSLYDVLEDPALAPVLSYEGLIAKIRKLMRW